MIKKLINNIKNSLNIKGSLADIKNMVLEYNYKPFVLPIVIVVVLYFALTYLNKGATQMVTEVRNKVEAQKAEIANEQEYKTSKAIYEELAEHLPPFEKRNEWLLAEMLAIFDKVKVLPSRTGKHNLEESGIFVLSSITYEVESDFAELGRLMESIENHDKFLRVSELAIARMEGNLGRLKTSFRVNTVFVNDGIRRV